MIVRSITWQVLIPPNIMEAEFHSPNWVPLCAVPGLLGHTAPLPSVPPAVARRSANALRVGAPALQLAPVGCRPNTATKELLIFYQGTWHAVGCTACDTHHCGHSRCMPTSDAPPQALTR